MWTQNDRRRFTEKRSGLDPSERENLLSLWTLTQNDLSIESQVMCAEILRELSRFDEARAFLRLIPHNDRLDDLLELIYDRAEKQDPVVFEIPQERPLNGRRERRRSAPPAWKTEAKMPPPRTPCFLRQTGTGRRMRQHGRHPGTGRHRWRSDFATCGEE